MYILSASVHQGLPGTRPQSSPAHYRVSADHMGELLQLCKLSAERGAIAGDGNQWTIRVRDNETSELIEVRALYL